MATTKPTNTATSEGSRGQKRKSDARQQADTAASLDHDEHPPAKKGKPLPATDQQSPSRPVPRPLQKNQQVTQTPSRPLVVPRPVQKNQQVAQAEEATSFDSRNSRNIKKRPSVAADTPDSENDAKTSKKAKIGGVDDRLPQALRRTGKPIFFCLKRS